MEKKPVERPNKFPKRITVRYVNNVIKAFNRLIEEPIVEEDKYYLCHPLSIKGYRFITKEDYELLAPLMDAKRDITYEIGENEYKTSMKEHAVSYVLKTRNEKTYILILNDYSLNNLRELIESIKIICETKQRRNTNAGNRD